MTPRALCTTKRIRNIYTHLRMQLPAACAILWFISFAFQFLLEVKKKITLHQLISCLIFPSSIQSFRVSAKRMDESQFDLFCAFLAFNLSTFRFFPPLFQYHDENSFCQVDSPSLSLSFYWNDTLFFTIPVICRIDLFLLILREVVRIFFLYNEIIFYHNLW